MRERRLPDGVTVETVHAVVDVWEHVLDPADPTRCLVHPDAGCFPRIAVEGSEN